MYVHIYSFFVANFAKYHFLLPQSFEMEIPCFKVYFIYLKKIHDSLMFICWIWVEFEVENLFYSVLYATCSLYFIFHLSWILELNFYSLYGFILAKVSVKNIYSCTYLLNKIYIKYPAICFRINSLLFACHFKF